MDPTRTKLRRRLVITACCLLLTVGCATADSSPAPGSEQPTGDTGPATATTEPTVGAGATPSTGEPLPSFPPGDPRNEIVHSFTSPPGPLTLTPTLEGQHAATAEIGPEGGTLTATAEDGTQYLLTIKADALPLPSEITMAPIASIAGFPAEIAPERTIGVDLAPDGLMLAFPAILEINPADPIPFEETFAFSYARNGADAGFQWFEQTDDTLTMEINHFSGVTIAYPIRIATERPAVLRELFTQAEIERRLASEVAFWATVVRQRELRGEETGPLRDFALQALSLFRRLIISPRVAVADRSCADANAALLAYLEYQRQRQILGVADDPQFDLLGAGLFVPAALVDLTVHVCFQEAYERCRVTGEFPALAVYYLSMLAYPERAFGIQPKPEWLELAHDYLRRCGRWRVRLSVSENDRSNADFPRQFETTSEYFVQWEPGEGLFGITQSSIEGSGPIEASQVRWGNYNIANVHSSRDSESAILHFEWDHFNTPLLPATLQTGVPKKLKLRVDLGEFAYTASHPVHQPQPVERPEYFGYTYRAAVNHLLRREWTIEEILFIEENHRGVITFDKDWQFRTSPFRATYAFSITLHVTAAAPSPVDTRVEVIVEHEPQ